MTPPVEIASNRNGFRRVLAQGVAAVVVAPVASAVAPVHPVNQAKAALEDAVEMAAPEDVVEMVAKVELAALEGAVVRLANQGNRDKEASVDVQVHPVNRVAGVLVAAVDLAAAEVVEAWVVSVTEEAWNMRRPFWSATNFM